MKIFNELKRNGFFGLVKYAYDKITSLIFYGPAVLIRTPNYIRNEGLIRISKGFSCGPGLVIDVFKNGSLVIEDGVKLNHRVHIGVMGEVRIDKGVLIASNVLIIDHSHGFYKGDFQSDPKSAPLDRDYEIAPIWIKRNAWIGEGVLIMPGVVIGEGAIVGAGSVVTKSIDASVIACGNPAKVIKRWSGSEWIPNA